MHYHPVLCYLGEGTSRVERVTYSELHQLVEKYVSALRRVGVVIGDRVVGKVAMVRALRRQWDILL